MKEVFLVLFKYADQFITMTNAEKAEAKIWSMIDDEDIAVLVSVVMDGAKQSKILATGVRKITKQYRLLRIGLITAPKLYETAAFYKLHGGFVLPWGQPRSYIPEQEMSVHGNSHA